MELTFCVQLPDFSTEENNKSIDFRQACQLLENIKWDAMADEEKLIVDRGEESCPCNVIFYNGKEHFQVLKQDGLFLVICSPNSWGNKILSLLVRHIDFSSSKNNLEFVDVKNLLELFFESRFDELILKMKNYKRRL
jgi:hypothetical protein